MGRLAFIGLDGVGLDLARHLAAQGLMPHLGRLMELGAAWETASPQPEVSPVCWSSMFSGEEPGSHGVYGFGRHEPGTYRVVPVDSADVQAPRLWERLSAAGRPSVVLNVPLTYPASQIRGCMVSGFVAPELTRAVHPPELLPRLHAIGYRPEADLEAGRGDPAALLADIQSALAVRLALFTEMLEEPWDFYCAVITDSDRVNHFAWPALWEQGHPLASSALGLYAQMDAFLGHVVARLAPAVEAGELSLMVAADHSFGPIRSEVYLNPWLQQEGLLKVEGPPGAERIHPSTLALALDPGRIYLNRQPRFSQGRAMTQAQQGEVLARIRQGLLALRFRRVEQEGGRVRVMEEAPVATVHPGADLYSGPQAHLAPDLVAVAAPGYSLRAGLGRAGVFGLSHLSGTHRPEGALALCWPPPPEKPERVSGLYGVMAGALGLGG